MRNNTLNLLLLRHGQTDANASGVLQGHSPTPLNRLGMRQANLLAARLAAFSPPVQAIISSDLARATQTAGPIASACGLPVVTQSAWRERGFGLLEGKPVGNKELWQAASGEIDPPGAEPTVSFQARIRTALLELPATYRNCQTIAVVTHGGPLRSILKMLGDQRLPAARGPRPTDIPQIANCSIFHLMARKYRAGIRWRIACVNDVTHLQDLATTQDAG